MSVLSPKINYHEIELACYLPKWHLPSSASFQCERNNAAPAGRSARPPGDPPALSLAELPLSLPSLLPVPHTLFFIFNLSYFFFFSFSGVEYLLRSRRCCLILYMLLVSQNKEAANNVALPSLLAVAMLWVAALNRCTWFSGVLFRRGFIYFICIYLSV